MLPELGDDEWERVRVGRAAQGLDPDRITDPVVLRRLAGLVHAPTASAGAAGGFPGCTAPPPGPPGEPESEAA